MKNKAVCAIGLRGSIGNNNSQDQVGVFGIGTNGALYYKLWDGKEWLPSNTDWLSLGGAFDSLPAAVVSWQQFGPDAFYIYGLINDQAYHSTVLPNTQLPWLPAPQPWEPFGGVFNSPLDAEIWGKRTDLVGNHLAGNSVAIAGIGTDSQPYLKLAPVFVPENPTMTDWLPLGRLLIYEPAIAAWGDDNNFDIFGVGVDGQMYHMVVDGNPWQATPPTPQQPLKLTGWQPVGGCFTSAPAVVKWSSSRIDIFGLGSNRAMYHRAWENGAWIIDWEGLGGVFDSPPAVVSWAPNRLDIFALGTNDQMYHKWWDGGWGPSQTDWEGLGGAFSSAPAVVSTGPNRLDIFGLGPDILEPGNHMIHKAWNGGPDWSPPKTDWDDLGGVFIIPRPAQMPSQLDFDAAITFPDPIALGGHAHVTLFKDGTSTFSGSLRDSGALAYNCAVACVVYDSQGRAYTFTQAGYAAGTFEPGKRDFNWNEHGDPNPNPQILANWNDLFGCGVKFKWAANVNVDGASLLPNLLPGVGQVINVVTK